MVKAPDQSKTAILGVRMTPELEAEVKVEAAARRVSVAVLFEEIWQIYKISKQGK